MKLLLYWLKLVYYLVMDSFIIIIIIFFPRIVAFMIALKSVNLCKYHYEPQITTLTFLHFKGKAKYSPCGLVCSVRVMGLICAQNWRDVGERGEVKEDAFPGGGHWNKSCLMIPLGCNVRKHVCPSLHSWTTGLLFKHWFIIASCMGHWEHVGA